MLEKVWRKGKPTALSVRMYIGVATMENNMKVPQKTENRTIMGPSNPTSRYIIFKKPKILIHKDAFTLMFIAVLFITAMIWKEAT